MTKQSTQINKTGRIIRASKCVISVSARILLELMEQCEDMNFLRYHNFYDDRTVREARYEYKDYMDRRAIYMRKQAIERLKESKYIKLRKEGDRVVVALTKNGKIKALQTIIRTSIKYFPNDKTCLVSFDFPEAARMARNNFRWFLKKAGFRYVQGSVWSIKKDVSPIMNELIKLLKIKQWVVVYVAMK